MRVEQKKSVSSKNLVSDFMRLLFCARKWNYVRKILRTSISYNGALFNFTLTIIRGRVSNLFVFFPVFVLRIDQLYFQCENCYRFGSDRWKRHAVVFFSDYETDHRTIVLIAKRSQCEHTIGKFADYDENSFHIKFEYNGTLQCENVEIHIVR